ncbi:MAG: DNA polymerase/3'-5' exonuclease PolX [Candidatus Omnitrophota bacterium]|jgi:DNA polymerase (family 10)|nr:MAG: DNA polymerase/3'-5' exonuclease PolX [Candidatus Omnitrophota bacterium]
MESTLIANIFRDIANILEIKGENIFRIRAYTRAAEVIEGFSGNLEEYVNEDKLQEIPGIGKDLSAKIIEIFSTGKLKFYEDLKRSIPEGLLEILNIPSIGPKTARLLYDKLGIKGIADLENAISEGRLLKLPGIKGKTVENIKKGIALFKEGRQRMLLPEAYNVSDGFIKYLSAIPAVDKISVAGSLRRKKETIRDIDILVTSKNPGKVMQAFLKAPSVNRVLAKGETKSSVITKGGVQVDCRVVKNESYGAALIYFTGSKDFNIKLRQLAIKKKLKINEYGIYRGNKLIYGKDEKGVFKVLGLDYVEPELRENTGEVELAIKSGLPILIQDKDIKGDLHVHSKWSDGINSIEEMAYAAKGAGYSYIAVTDHSQSLKVAGGLSIGDLRKKKKEIDKINSKLNNFRVLYGTEVDIDSEGNIDYDDDILKEFDIVVAAIHTGFKQARIQITSRLVRACNNKYVNIIAHPTGRLWGVRPSYDVDWEKVLSVARDTNTTLEINSFAQRLDLDSHDARRAAESGVKLAINTDSHDIGHLKSIKFGVGVARRAWLKKEDVINTLTLDELLKKIRK